jgi:OFA family oxalate/formate antiporter-like MFS transporter
MVAWPGVFYAIALLVGLPGFGAALMLKNPPADQAMAPHGIVHSGAVWSRLRWLQSGRFWRVWLVFFCNITAGIMLIGFQSPMFQDALKARDAFMSAEALAAAGGSLIAMSSAFNGIGRIFWGSLSDRLGRLKTFRAILLSQVAAFVLLTQVSNPFLFGVLICYILLCYGGGFGTMPSLVATIFGGRAMATVYGCLLTAWAAGGLVGPQIAAVIIDQQGVDPTHGAGLIFLVGAALLALGALLAFSLDDAPFESSDMELAMVKA